MGWNHQVVRIFQLANKRPQIIRLMEITSEIQSSCHLVICPVRIPSLQATCFMRFSAQNQAIQLGWRMKSGYPAGMAHEIQAICAFNASPPKLGVRFLGKPVSSVQFFVICHWQKVHQLLKGQVWAQIAESLSSRFFFSSFPFIFHISYTYTPLKTNMTLENPHRKCIFKWWMFYCLVIFQVKHFSWWKNI